MFDIAPSELLVVGLVALVVIGPKDLPRVMRHVGKFVGKARGMARHFRAGFDEMVREAELEEMERHWREENERIMREHAADHPPLTSLPPAEPAASEPPPAAAEPAPGAATDTAPGAAAASAP